MRRQSSLARLLGSAAVTAILAAGLGGCQTMADVKGALTSKSEPALASDADPRRAAEVYGERYRANPRDADTALRYGMALRATGQRAQAVAVLEQGSIAHPTNKAMLAAYGRSLADNGNFQQAFDVLSRAHSPDNPDWREPSVLSNLGLSYVLSKELPKAEETLRRAQATGRADARVRQNLALAVGLQGRFAEAETIVKADLPADEAAANVAYLKQMLNRKDIPRTARNGKPPVVAFSPSDD